MSILERFPQEILDIVLQNLKTNDGKTLRSTSRILKNMTESSACWKLWMNDKWFFINDSRFNEMKNSEKGKIRNYYEYFHQRELDDKEMHLFLIQITSEYDDVKKIQGVWDFIERFNSEFKVIPFLLLYEKHNLALHDTMKKNQETFVSQLYTIDMLCRAYRSRLLFGIIQDHFNDNLNYSTEEAYYRLSHFDPAFYKIVCFREKVQQHVCKSVKTHIKDISTFNKETFLTNVDIVCYIAQQVPKAISLVTRNVFDQSMTSRYSVTVENSFESIESLSILRYYCGEIKNPSVVMKYAVIQKIASMLGIEVSFSRIFMLVASENGTEPHKVLVFKDNKLKDHIQFESTESEEYLSYVNSHYSNRNVSSLSEIKSWHNIVKHVFTADAVPYLDTIHVSLRSHPSRVIQCKKDILLNIFSKSKIGVSEEYWNYLKAYYKLMEVSRTQRSAELLRYYNFSRGFLLSLKVRYFGDLPVLKKYWPKSLIHEYYNEKSHYSKDYNLANWEKLESLGKIDEYFNKLESKITDEYTEEFIKTLSLCKYPEYLHPTEEQKVELSKQHRLQLGDCVRYEKFRDSKTVLHGVIVGWSHLYFTNNTDASLQPTMIVQDLIKRFVRNNEVFYNVLVYETGTMKIIEENALQYYNGADRKELINEMGDYYMGLFFNGYDFSTNRFIPTSTLERYFAIKSDRSKTAAPASVLL